MKMLIHWYSEMKAERFAGFFMENVVTGLGARYELSRYRNGLLLAPLYHRKIKPDELLLVAIAANEVIKTKVKSLPEGEAKRGLERQREYFDFVIIEQLFSNSQLGELFPFGRHAVETILNRAWIANMGRFPIALGPRTDQEKILTSPE